MTEIVVYTADRLQAHRARILLAKHGIASKWICDEPQKYPYAHTWGFKPDTRVLVAAEQVAEAQELLAPLQLQESREATHIARRMRWRFVGMALCLTGGGIFTAAAVFGPGSYAIGAVVCFTALLVLLVGASHQSITKPERER